MNGCWGWKRMSGPTKSNHQGKINTSIAFTKASRLKVGGICFALPIGKMGKSKKLGVPGKRTLPPDYRHPQLHPGSHGQSRVPSWTWQQPPNPSPDFWQQQQLGIVQWKGGQWKSNLETLDILCVGSLGVQMCHVNSWGGMCLFNSFVVCVCLA